MSAEDEEKDEEEDDGDHERWKRRRMKMKEGQTTDETEAAHWLLDQSSSAR